MFPYVYALNCLANTHQLNFLLYMLERMEIISQSFEISSHFTLNSSQTYFVYRTENDSIFVLKM